MDFEISKNFLNLLWIYMKKKPNISTETTHRRTAWRANQPRKQRRAKSSRQTARPAENNRHGA
jgi:hypothetical protein